MHTSELIGISACAERLAAHGDPVERSTLSRYCAKHDLKRGKSGRETLVDFAEVRAHRAENYTREVMGGATIADPSGQAAAAGHPPARSPAALPPDRALGRSLAEVMADAQPAPPVVTAADALAADPARRKKTADAIRSELEIAARLRAVVPVDEVDAGVAELIAGLREAATGGLRDAADALVADLGLPSDASHAVHAHLKRFARQIQAAAVAKASETARALEEGDAAARARMTHLAAVALRQRQRLQGAAA